MNFPREAFELYVKSMPQSEAQTALLFLVNFLSEGADNKPRLIFEPLTPEGITTDPSTSPTCKALLDRQCEDCEE
jgi:hypothetical protein